MLKQDEVQKERMRLDELFREAPPEMVQLVAGLLDDAAFLVVENNRLRESMKITGMVKIHTENPERQRVVETAGQYLKNVNSYNAIIKTLAGVLRGSGSGEDAFDEWQKEQQEN